MGTIATVIFSLNLVLLTLDMDIQVGSVLGHHFSTRVLYAIHRNQKSYLMYHNTYKKWLVITDDEFIKDVSNKINLNRYKNLDENNLAVYRFGQNQWMGMNKYNFALLCNERYKNFKTSKITN